MAARRIAVTFDYRCPFARNAHEAVVAAVRAGSEIEWRFVPFSLDQAHVDAGYSAVWDRPPTERGSGVLALTWGIAVRDAFPEHFLAFHVACFAARHDEHQRIQDEPVLRGVAAGVGLDADAVAAEVATGAPLAALAAEHTRAVEDHAVFGVPTFIEGEHAAFVRLMERGSTDDLAEIVTILPMGHINEFKRTRLPR